VLLGPGVEADAEAVLWLLCQQLACQPDLHADVVFLAGHPQERALMRWAKLITTVSSVHEVPGVNELDYYLGPETNRPMRYFIDIDYALLEKAGMGDIRQFRGGSYDVILQASPLNGFSADFSFQQAGIEHALKLIKRGPIADVSLHIVVGPQDSVNSPKDDLHTGFVNFLSNLGFSTVFVDATNYANWDGHLLGILPSTLVDLAMQECWSKAVGRIPPTAASLLVRFRVNTRLNYDVISRAFRTWQSQHQSDDRLSRAEEWWNSIATDVTKSIRDGYIKLSRASDQKNRKDAYGNPAIKAMVGHNNSYTWESVMSTDCVNDVLEAFKETKDSLFELSVDEVMCRAVTLMTGKLLTIFAFTVFVQGAYPDKRQYMPYVLGNESASPLDFYMFPRMFGDMNEIQKLVVGNAIQNTSSMLLALLVAAAEKEDGARIAFCLEGHHPVFSDHARQEVLLQAFKGEDITKLLRTHSCMSAEMIPVSDMKHSSEWRDDGPDVLRLRF